MLIRQLLLISVLIAQQQNDPIDQFSFETVGHAYQFTLTKGMLEESPKWSNSENPPLSLASVKAMSEKYVAKKFPDKNLEVASISLKREFLIDRWFFVVILETSPNTIEDPFTYEVVILTNGKIVEPTENGKILEPEK
jgi:hypothetical protein